MNNNLTEIAVIVDRSGSMQALWTDTMGGLRQFVADQKKLPGEANFSLVLFDNLYEQPRWRVPLAQVDLDLLEFGPRGSTALYDAIGRTANLLGAALAQTPEAERPGRVIVAIFTDGQENASAEFDQATVMTMIQHQEQTYDWTFLFLAAGKEALAEAQNLGMASSRTLSYAATGEEAQLAYATLNCAVQAVRDTQAPQGTVVRESLNLQQTFDKQKAPKRPSTKQR